MDRFFRPAAVPSVVFVSLLICCFFSFVLVKNSPSPTRENLGDPVRDTLLTLWKINFYQRYSPEQARQLDFVIETLEQRERAEGRIRHLLDSAYYLQANQFVLQNRADRAYPILDKIIERTERDPAEASSTAGAFQMKNYIATNQLLNYDKAELYGRRASELYLTAIRVLPNDSTSRRSVEIGNYLVNLLNLSFSYTKLGDYRSAEQEVDFYTREFAAKKAEFPREFELQQLDSFPQLAYYSYIKALLKLYHVAEAKLWDSSTDISQELAEANLWLDKLENALPPEARTFFFNARAQVLLLQGKLDMAEKQLELGRQAAVEQGLEADAGALLFYKGCVETLAGDFAVGQTQMLEGFRTLGYEVKNWEKLPPVDSLDPARTNFYHLSEMLARRGNLFRQVAAAERQTHKRQLLLRVAFDSFEKNIALLDALRRTMASDRSIENFNARYHFVYAQAALTAADLYELSTNAPAERRRWFEEAWRASELGRGFTLRQAIFRQANRDICPSCFEKDSQLRRDLAEMTWQIAIKDSSKWQERRTKLQAEMSDFIEALHVGRFAGEQGSRYFQLLCESEIATSRQLRDSVLQKEQALLSYFAVANQQMLLFAMKKSTSPMLLKIKVSHEAERQICDFRQQQTTSDFHVEQFAPLAHAVYKVLIPSEVEKYLPTRVVVVCSDSLLSNLPFDALLSRPAAAGGGDLQNWYWIRRHALSRCPSATVLRMVVLRDYRSTAREPLLAMAPFADPLLGREMPDAPSVLACNLNDLLTITQSKTEVEEIVKLTGSRTPPLLGEQARLDLFLEQCSKHRIIQLSQHGAEKCGNLPFPVLFFRPERSPEQGMLFLPKVYGLMIRADLVGLNACQSNSGPHLTGEGLMSFSRALLYAGAKSVLASNWNVFADSGSRIMTDFYRFTLLPELGQATELDKDLALQKAKLIHLNKSPYYWAGFSLDGDVLPLSRF